VDRPDFFDDRCHHHDMCGRYVLKTSAIDLREQLLLDDGVAVTARYNLAPLQAAPIITDAAPRVLTLAQWGLLPFWAKDARLASKLINARAETVATNPAFKSLVQTHRCLVPCDGFYEWTRDGQARVPHYVHAPDDRVLTMAGLWSVWRSPDDLEVTTFTIITTAANAMMRSLHTRMPAFLDRPARQAWRRHVVAGAVGRHVGRAASGHQGESRRG
jgi:putative SOS response-associated peptidase YedK